MAEVTRVRINVESAAFDDMSGEDSVDFQATADAYVELVEKLVAERFPDAEVDVQVLGDNQFARESIVLEYDDGNVQTSPDEGGSYNDDILWLENDLFGLYGEGAFWRERAAH